MADSGHEHHKLSHIIAIAGLLLTIIGIVIGAVCQLYPDQVRSLFTRSENTRNRVPDTSATMVADRPNFPETTPKPRASPDKDLSLPSISVAPVSLPVSAPKAVSSPNTMSSRPPEALAPSRKASAKIHIQKALETVEFVSGSQERWQALVAICQAFSSLGDSKAALETARKVDSEWMKARALIPVAMAQRADGDLKQARQTFSRINEILDQYPDEDLKITMLSEFAPAQFKAGAIDDARANIVRAQSMVNNFESVVGKAEALSEIGIAQIRIGEESAGRETLRKAKAVAESHPKPYYRAHVLTEVALAQAASGNFADSNLTFDQAQSILGALKRDSEISEISRDIAKAKALAGDITGATEIADDIKEPLNRQWAFDTIKQARAKKLAESNQLPMAENVVNTLSKEARCHGHISIAFGILGLDQSFNFD